MASDRVRPCVTPDQATSAEDFSSLFLSLFPLSACSVIRIPIGFIVIIITQVGTGPVMGDRELRADVTEGIKKLRSGSLGYAYCRSTRTISFNFA